MKKEPRKSNGNKARYRDEPGLVNVIFQLKDADAERFLHYKEREKLRTHGQAAYKLMFERLDQLDKAG